MKRETSDVSLIIEDIFGSPIDEDVEEDDANDDDANSRHSDDQDDVDYKDDICESYYDNSLDDNDTDNDASCEMKLIETDETDPFEMQKQLSSSVKAPLPSKRMRKTTKQIDSAETEETGEIKSKVRLNQFPSPQKCEFCSRTFLSIASYNPS